MSTFPDPVLPQVGFTMEAFLAGLGRKLLCGNGTGSEMLDRVRVDFACLEVTRLGSWQGEETPVSCRCQAGATAATR